MSEALCFFSRISFHHYKTTKTHSKIDVIDLHWRREFISRDFYILISTRVAARQQLSENVWKHLINSYCFLFSTFVSQQMPINSHLVLSLELSFAFHRRDVIHMPINKSGESSSLHIEPTFFGVLFSSWILMLIHLSAQVIRLIIP